MNHSALSNVLKRRKRRRRSTGPKKGFRAGQRESSIVVEDEFQFSQFRKYWKFKNTVYYTTYFLHNKTVSCWYILFHPTFITLTLYIFPCLHLTCQSIPREVGGSSYDCMNFHRKSLVMHRRHFLSSAPLSPSLVERRFPENDQVQVSVALWGCLERILECCYYVEMDVPIGISYSLASFFTSITTYSLPVGITLFIPTPPLETRSLCWSCIASEILVRDIWHSQYIGETVSLTLWLLRFLNQKCGMGRVRSPSSIILLRSAKL